MRIWAVANQKGGVGKTTTAVTLAGILAQRGQKVLMVDLDPHGSMTTWFGFDPDAIERSAYAIFNPDVTAREATFRLILATQFEGLHLLPASTAMATLDRQLGTREGMGLVLARALHQVRERFDIVLIDCPPVLGVLMINALAASELLIMPVQTEFLALKGLERMTRTITMVTRARRRPLTSIIVPTMFDRRTRASLESLKQLKDAYPETIWRSAIPIDTLFREASRLGIPLSWHNPQARGVIAYTLLLDAILQLPALQSATSHAAPTQVSRA
jgi:chromosome partitioning protein